MIYIAMVVGGLFLGVVLAGVVIALIFRAGIASAIGSGLNW